MQPNEQLRWTEVGTFVNSWANLNATTTAAYTKTSDGLVILRGLITSGASDTTAFYLPQEFRPARDSYPGTSLAISGTYFPGLVIVTTDGRVIPSFTIGASTLAYFSLEGCLFHTAL